MITISLNNRAPIRLPSFPAVLATLLATIAAVLLWITPVARAQEEIFTIQLAWPAEGETLYAGPTSLLYSVSINGWVQGTELDPEKLEIVLEIFQDQRIVETISTSPGIDGRFEFLLTVNPDGSHGDFPAENASCGDYCHLPGQTELPVGDLTLRITASSSIGDRQSIVERNITIDRSSYATVPVKVYLNGDFDHPISDVEVNGHTRLYDWRTRNAIGSTDEAGTAFVKVEVLSQAPTNYLFSASPTIVDGILYEPLDSAEITIEPGETSTSAIILNVSVKTGEIQGFLESTTEGPLGGLSIHAVLIPTGTSYRTVTMADGTFRFEDLPIERYRITAGEEIADGTILRSGSIDVDLFESHESRAELMAVDLESLRVQGQIFGDSGTAIPFAWVRTEDGASSATVFPGDGMYTIAVLQDEPVLLTAMAPGFFSQAMKLDPSSDSLAYGDFALVQQDGTEVLPWGNGEIIIPAESDVQRNNVTLTLRRGWLWGQVEGEPLTVRVAGREISLTNASFSIEYLPGQRAWLYLTDGLVSVTPLASGEGIDVKTGQMVNLLNDGKLVPVPVDPVVFHTLQENNNPAVDEVWEPTLGARIQNSLARLSVGTVQTVTFVTYFLVSLGVLLVPLGTVYWWWRQRT